MICFSCANVAINLLERDMPSGKLIASIEISFANPFDKEISNGIIFSLRSWVTKRIGFGKT
jgi:hypothetical protein